VPVDAERRLEQERRKENVKHEVWVYARKHDGAITQGTEMVPVFDCADYCSDDQKQYGVWNWQERTENFTRHANYKTYDWKQENH
jgi:hypothetical protein